MRVYTVHEPVKRKGIADTDPARFVFVRDGFHFWAFVLAPVWMLARGLWLVLLGYIVMMGALQAVLFAVGASSGTRLTVGLLVSFLVGLEAATLHRWTLRKWRMLGVVVGRDAEDAERRFFDQWVAREWDAQSVAPSTNVAASSASMGSMRTATGPASASTDVIGLFPGVETRR